MQKNSQKVAYCLAQMARIAPTLKLGNYKFNSKSKRATIYAMWQACAIGYASNPERRI